MGETAADFLVTVKGRNEEGSSEVEPDEEKEKVPNPLRPTNGNEVLCRESKVFFAPCTAAVKHESGEGHICA